MYKNTESKSPKVFYKIQKNNLSINCAVHHSKKLKFIKKPESSGLLKSFGLKTPLSKIPAIDNISV